jgi:hypothetical protein
MKVVIQFAFIICTFKWDVEHQSELTNPMQVKGWADSSENYLIPNIKLADCLVWSTSQTHIRYITTLWTACHVAGLSLSLSLYHPLDWNLSFPRGRGQSPVKELQLVRRVLFIFLPDPVLSSFFFFFFEESSPVYMREIFQSIA